MLFPLLETFCPEVCLLISMLSRQNEKYNVTRVNYASTMLDSAVPGVWFTTYYKAVPDCVTLGENSKETTCMICMSRYWTSNHVMSCHVMSCHYLITVELHAVM